MIKNILFIISYIILFDPSLTGQDFLQSYNEYCLHKLGSKGYSADNFKLIKSNKWVRQYKYFIKQRINQLDTIFKDYKTKKNFDFNTADSLIIIYQTDSEDNLSDFIIFNMKDTISYSEIYVEGNHNKIEINTIYKPFLNEVYFNERDSLLILASRKDFKTAQKFSIENPVYDGANTTILFIKKDKGKYLFEECFLQPFALSPDKYKSK